MKRLLLLSLFVGCIQMLWAQEVSFEASAPQVVAVGEQFRLTFTVNSRPTTFHPPTIGNFDVLAGPSQSSFSSTQIVNGQVTQSESISFTYVLQADKEGKFKIGSAQVTVKGKNYITAPFEIEVVKSSDSGSPSQSQRTSTAQDNPSSNAGDLFVRVDVNKRSVYLGEAVEASIDLYVRGVNIKGFENYKLPSFNGFWNQEVETPNQLVFKRENVNGRIYNVGVIKKYLLFPQQTGEVKIDPCVLDLILEVKSNDPQNIFDDFFGGSYETLKKHIVSPTVGIMVKPLPEVGKPGSYSGAVGDFTLDGSLDRHQLKANDAATYHLKISGTGNLKLIGPPKISFPADFDTYDPKISEDIKTSGSGSTGSKSFDYPIIPRSAGTFTIPAIEFSYFNPATGKYSVLKTSPLELTVSPDASGGSTTSVVYGGVSKQDLKVLGKDILFIKVQPQHFVDRKFLLVESWMYYFGYVLILVLSVFVWLFLTKKQKERSDISLYRNRKANKMARRRLKNAEIALKSNNSDTYFEELHKAILGYLSDKLSIPSADLTSMRIAELLQANKVDEQTSQDVLEVISQCEFARYSPSASIEKREQVFAKAVALISSLEQLIR